MGEPTETCLDARWPVALSAILLVGILQPRPASALDCTSLNRVAAAAPARTVVLAEGDSITSGDGSTDGRGSYVSRSPLSSDARYSIVNHGRSQAIMGSSRDDRGANSLYGRMIDDDKLLSSKSGDTSYILTVLIGRNDLVNYGAAAPYLQDLVRYARAMKRAGWDEVYVGTLLPSAWAPFGALRQEFNRDLRSLCLAEPGAIDKVIDFGAIPGMSDDRDAFDQGMFVDGTHPSNAGYDLMARSYGAVFQN